MIIQKSPGRYSTGRNVTHPEISYTPGYEIDQEIKLVNSLVRSGLNLRQISEQTGIPIGRVGRRYYGDAVRCLTDEQIKELRPRLKQIEFTQRYNRPARDNETATHYRVKHRYETTLTELREAEDHELTDTMAIPLIVEEYEVSRVMNYKIDPNFRLWIGGTRIRCKDLKHTKLRPEPMVAVYSTVKQNPSVSVMYRGACCDI